MKINDRSHRSVSSYHGGACVAYADGSVELLDDATTEERVRELLAQ
jgi:prepilin-type processing-associated H-X9-DG protein